MRNLRFAWRSLSRNPGFAIAAIISLALGIGANTAIFTLADQMLWRLLPVKEPHRLVLFRWQGNFIGGMSRGAEDTFAYPVYADIRDGNPGAFTNIAATYQDTADVADHGPAARAIVELVSGNYFDTLGTTAALGRMLTPEDDRLGQSQAAVVLSYQFWQKQFGGNPAVLNRTIELNGNSVTVVGVTGRGFKGFRMLDPTDVFAPMAMKTMVTPTWDDMKLRTSIWVKVFGRLQNSATLASAQAAIQTAYHTSIENDLAEAKRNAKFQQMYRRNWLKLDEAAQGFTSTNEIFAKPIRVLLIMVGTLLLLACVNVANLLITRSAGRRKEIAIRLSLGATRPALIRLMMGESLLIALGGGVLGVVLSGWVASVLVRQIPFEQMAVAVSTTPDLRVLAFSAALTLLTSILFGLAPAVYSSHTDLAPVLKSEAVSVSQGRSQTRVRIGLVAVQVTLSFVLLAGAGLFARSLYNLFSVNAGIDTGHLLTFSVDPSLHKYTPQRSHEFFQAVQSQLSHAPGVLSVSAASYAILAGEGWENTTMVEGYQAGENEDMQAKWNEVLPGFFTTVGSALVAGRDFTPLDAGRKVQPVIVNEAFVKRFFKDGIAVGRHVGFGGPPNIEIIGVVKDMKAGTLKDGNPPRNWTASLDNKHPGGMTFYVRTRGNPMVAAQAARDTVKRLDASLPVFDMKSMETQMDETHFIERLFAMLAGAFGTLATLLAAVGLFGVTAYSVTRRTQEIGIRIALGAERSSVMGLVLREVGIITGLGLAVGIPLSVALGRLVESQLFGMKGLDPVALGGAVVVIAVASLAAGYFPARRATRIDPLLALRYE